MVDHTRRRWSREDDDRLDFYWVSDDPVWSIAERMGRTPGALYEHAKLRGLPLRNDPLKQARPGSPNHGLSPTEVHEKLTSQAVERTPNRDREYVDLLLAAGGMPVLDVKRQCWIWPTRRAA